MSLKAYLDVAYRNQKVYERERQEERERMANETNADRRSRQRDALKGSLSGLSVDATKHLAEEVREAAFSAPDVHRRIVEVFERLGVKWPVGYKP